MAISPFYMQQTNTADMLDEAVEYVKFLQKKIQVLTLNLSWIIVHLCCYSEDKERKFGIWCYTSVHNWQISNFHFLSLIQKKLKVSM